MKLRSFQNASIEVKQISFIYQQNRFTVKKLIGKMQDENTRRKVWWITCGSARPTRRIDALNTRIAVRPLFSQTVQSNGSANSKEPLPQTMDPLRKDVPKPVTNTDWLSGVCWRLPVKC